MWSMVGPLHTEITAAVTACTRPAHDQGSSNPGVEQGGSHRVCPWLGSREGLIEFCPWLGSY